MGWAWGRQWNGRTSWTRGWGRRKTVQLWASWEQVLMSISFGTVRSCLPSHAYVQGQTPRTGAGGSGSWAGAAPGSVCGPFLAAERVLPRRESSTAGVSTAHGPPTGPSTAVVSLSQVRPWALPPAHGETKGLRRSQRSLYSGADAPQGRRACIASSVLGPSCGCRSLLLSPELRRLQTRFLLLSGAWL